jgi:membrane-bound lytic murein transglycosylase MltF
MKVSIVMIATDGCAMLSVTRVLCVVTVLCTSAACNPADSAPSGKQTSVHSAGPNTQATQASPGIFMLSAEEQGLPPELESRSIQWTGDFDDMVKRRFIRILTVFQPGWYYLDGPHEKGLTYEFSRQFETFVNNRLDTGHLKIHVILIPVEFDQLQDALIAGYGDIIAGGYTLTEERRERLDFSQPVSKPFDEIMVTGPSAPHLARLEELSGRQVYARRLSSHQSALMKLSSRLEQDGHGPIQVMDVPRYLDDSELLELIDTGVLPMAAMDSFKAKFWAGVFPNIAVREDLVLRANRQLAWAFRKNSPLLEAVINDFAKTHQQGTLTGNVIINRYQGQTRWLDEIKKPEEISRFATTIGWFRRYGEEYGFDPLLLAAQGYQESRLDQNVRSPAGAIGIMQLLPSTAADPNVDIPDIENPESNIHAGARYLRFIRDRYFDDPAISPLDQTLFAFAAYNAGPARIVQLRKAAEQAGLDPNVWMDHVERVAARDIGQETVQYVANIFKYYLAYSMLEKRSFPRLDPG